MLHKIKSFFKSIVGIGLLGSILIIVLFSVTLNFEKTNLLLKSNRLEVYDDRPNGGSTISELKTKNGQYYYQQQTVSKICRYITARVNRIKNNEYRNEAY